MCSRRVFAPVKLLRVGAIFAPGKRPVTSVLRVMGTRDDRHCQRYHRALSRAPWPAWSGGPLLLRWLLPPFVPTGPVVGGIDETIERRRGEQSAAKGLSRHPVRASPAPLVNARGWRWVRLMLRPTIPWTTRLRGGPVLPVLSPAARYDQPRGRAPRTRLDRARHAVWLVRRGLPTRRLVVVGAHPSAALEGREAGRDAVGVMTRMRLAAARDEPAPYAGLASADVRASRARGCPAWRRPGPSP
jgi:DDE superfamily endonuclease